MGRKKKDEDLDQIPLSETQNTAITGRVDVTVTDAGDSGPARKQTSSIEIKSAELVDQMFCNYKYKHTVGPNTTNTVTTKSEVPVHHDLVAAFRRLDPHLAVICEEVDPAVIGDINDIDHQTTADRIEKFEVTKFTVDGPAESMTLVLAGLKELSTGESIKLETPKINIDGSYPFADELASTIQDCLSEVHEYMHGKQAESNQLEIEFAPHDSLVEEDL